MMYRLLRALALVVLLVGAVGSVWLTLGARQHPPPFLLVLFLGWVLLPCVALAFAEFRSRAWSVMARKALYVVMLVVGGDCVAIYVSVTPAGTRPTAVFLIVPAVSWVIMAIAALIIAFVSRRRPT